MVFNKQISDRTLCGNQCESQLVKKQQLIQKFLKFRLIHGVVVQDILTLAGNYTRESNSLNFKLIFSIYHYSTASIGGKIYIIGCNPDEHRISVYNDDQWSDYGSLFTGRYVHSSISFNSKTMVLGAFSDLMPDGE